MYSTTAALLDAPSLAKRFSLAYMIGVAVICPCGNRAAGSEPKLKRPNILLAISDDQSWPHAGAYGDTALRTPAFDRVARHGVLFTHAFCPASQCSPSRASLLTGHNIWQLEVAGTQASLFPAKSAVYTDLLAQVGYHVGYTGKPWAPGNWNAAAAGRVP
jgi:uncharacterized sulfatase